MMVGVLVLADGMTGMTDAHVESRIND